MRKWIAGLLGATTLVGGGTALFAADARANPFDDKGTHYELPITSDIPQGERVEISKTEAALTLKGWNDEYAMTIKPQIPTALLGAVDRPFTVEANRPLLSKRMEYKNGDVTAFIEPKEGTLNEFDIDFTLHAKPDTNVFEYKIEGAEEFDFFYQPELTAQEIADGASRPENVVGSYAVYHKTKANHRVGSTNYATGKAFHIYRPKAIDANAAEIWAELSYMDGTLTVTVPKKFLDDAVYPLKVDPTFGYTSDGGTSGFAENRIFALYAAPASNGTVTSISYYALNSSGVDSNIKSALYAFTSITDAGAKLVESAENLQALTTSPELFSNAVADYSVTASTNYWIAVWCPSVTGNTSLRLDSTPIDGSVWDLSETYGTWPSPLDESTNTNRFSIYATYTAAGGAAAPALQDIIFFE